MRRNCHSARQKEQINDRLPPSPSWRSTPSPGLRWQKGQLEWVYPSQCMADRIRTNSA